MLADRVRHLDRPAVLSKRVPASADRPISGVPPLMVGYLRVHQLKATRAEITAVFDEYARRKGFRLAEVFIEQDSTTPSAFGELIAAVKHHSARAVVVPSIDHLAVLGGTPLREMLQRITGAQVHEMDRAPIRR